MASPDHNDDHSKASGLRINAAWVAVAWLLGFAIGTVADVPWANSGGLEGDTLPQAPQRPSAKSALVSTEQLLDQNKQEQIRLLNVQTREEAQLEENRRTLAQLKLQGFDPGATVCQRLRKENAELTSRVAARKARLLSLEKLVNSLADARDAEARRGHEISHETEVDSRQRVLEHEQGLNASSKPPTEDNLSR